MKHSFIDSWVKAYETTSCLPEKKVPCTKCGTGVTMWSTNLSNRIKKYSGIRNLLETFVCKSCSKSFGAVKAVKKNKKVKEIKKNVINSVKEETQHVPFKFQSTGVEVIDLIENVEYCQKFTRENGCWRPDIYLDGNKSCDNCALYKNCQASCRRLSTDKRKRNTD